MVEGIIAAMVLITGYLGVRLFQKLRDISSWKPDEDFSQGAKGKSLPPELRNLRIDEPTENLSGLSDDGGEKHAGINDTESDPNA